MAREHVRLVEVEGNTYRITDFDALNGGYVFLFVVKKIIPLLQAVDVDFMSILSMESKDGFGRLLSVIMPVLDSISKDDLKEFMGQCLEQVEISLPAGYEKVMRNGIITVDAVRYSTKMAFMLCFQAIEGIITDFFGEKGLGFLSKLKPQDTKSRSRKT